MERSFIHPGWNADRRQRSTFNIALLKLAKASKHRVPNLLLDHFNLITGQRLAAVGWGSGTNGPDLGADVFGSLKIEPQEFVDSGHCNRSTLWNGAVRDGIICGLNQARKASCVGECDIRYVSIPFLHWLIYSYSYQHKQLKFSMALSIVISQSRIVSHLKTCYLSSLNTLLLCVCF